MPSTLIQDIEAFLVAFPEVTPAMVGRLSIGDKQLVPGLREPLGQNELPREPRLVTQRRVRAWMSAYIEEHAVERSFGHLKLQELRLLMKQWDLGPAERPPVAEPAAPAAARS